MYTILLVLGVMCVLDKPWMWTIQLCWEDFPFHMVDDNLHAQSHLF